MHKLPDISAQSAVGLEPTFRFAQGKRCGFSVGGQFDVVAASLPRQMAA
jgi:hypothetical protein